MRPSPGSAPTYRYIGATAKSRDGWDSLGDLGYFDADGFLYLNDRRVDMFTVGGRNVYPAEIESRAVPRTRMCCPAWWSACPTRISVRCRMRSCRPTGSTRPPSCAFLAERVAGYKVPRTVEFIDTPLRDDAGKARRSAVRDEVIARRQARARQLTELSSGGAARSDCCGDTPSAATPPGTATRPARS